jgi:hypothetical protein
LSEDTACEGTYAFFWITNSDMCAAGLSHGETLALWGFITPKAKQASMYIAGLINQQHEDSFTSSAVRGGETTEV